MNTRAKLHGCAGTDEHAEDVERGRWARLHYQFPPIALPPPLYTPPQMPEEITGGWQSIVTDGVWKDATVDEFVAHLDKEETKRDHYDYLSPRAKSGWETRPRFGWERVQQADGSFKKVKANIAVDQTWVSMAPAHSDWLKDYVCGGLPYVRWARWILDTAARIIAGDIDEDWGRELLAWSFHPNERVLHFHAFGTRVVKAPHGGYVLKRQPHVGKKGQSIRGTGRVSRGAPAIDRLLKAGAIPADSAYGLRFEHGIKVWASRHPNMAVPADIKTSRKLDEFMTEVLPGAPGGDKDKLKKLLDYYNGQWAEDRRAAINRWMDALQKELDALGPEKPAQPPVALATPAAEVAGQAAQPKVDNLPAPEAPRAGYDSPEECLRAMGATEPLEELLVGPPENPEEPPPGLSGPGLK